MIGAPQAVDAMVEPTAEWWRLRGVITRRQVLALASVAALSACAGKGTTTGEDAGSAVRAGSMSLVKANLPRDAASAPARTAMVSAVAEFSADLLAALGGSGNLVCSPYSIAEALAMTLQGAKGATAAQMLEVLHADDAATVAGGLNAIDQALAGRSGSVPDPNGGKPEQVVLAVANSLWGQRGEPWQPPFLDVLARDFGTGMRQVDYGRPEAARAAINAWVSQQTRARIPNLIPSGVLDADSRLTLVNALYLKAAWQNPFDHQGTHNAPFHRLDGSSVTADLMTSAETADRFASGPGWVAADLPYARGKLAMTVVVPDAGRFAEVRTSMTKGLLPALRIALRPSRVQVSLPRWTTRTQVGLNDVLTHLGMPLAFTSRADFSGMTKKEALELTAVLHEGFIAVNEAGTEAAAATAAVVSASSAVVAPPRTVVADRPFLYVVHDRPTGTPLFVGQVLDPSV